MPAPSTNTIRVWAPAVVVAVSLVAAILINAIAHAEIALSLLVAGAIACTIALTLSGRSSLPWGPVTWSLLLLVGYYAAQAPFTTTPMISVYGAYDSNSSLFAVFAIAIGYLAFGAIGHFERESSEWRAAVAAIAATVTLYCVASCVAAWQWGRTDEFGGPASGFTPNSQYHAQLLIIGLAAAVTWAVLQRRDRVQVLIAAAAAVIIAFNVYLTQASAALVGVVIGLAYACAAYLGRARLSPRLQASVWTVLFTLVGAGVTVALLSPATAPSLVDRLDTFGNGRGALWVSAARVFAQHPVVGRGLSHITGITQWRLDGEVLDVTTTTDPHNLFLLLAASGGVVGLALAVWALYAVQRRLLEMLAGFEGAEALACSALLAGAVALFVVAQFSFVYPVAWALAAIMLPVAFRASEGRPLLTPRQDRIALVALGALSAAVLACLWIPLPNRVASLSLLAQGGFGSPGSRLDAQLALVDDVWDVLPANNVLVLYSSGLKAAPSVAEMYGPRVDEKRVLVAPNRTWDGRLTSKELTTWVSAARAGRVDLAQLRETADAGIAADPGSGMWATSACSFMASYGDEIGAARYARLVRDDPVWWSQAKRSADAQTIALIETLAAP